jgi:hypothetical protein
LLVGEPTWDTGLSTVAVAAGATAVVSGVAVFSCVVALSSVAGPQAESNISVDARHRAEIEFFIFKPLIAKITQSIMPLKIPHLAKSETSGG